MKISIPLVFAAVATALHIPTTPSQTTTSLAREQTLLEELSNQTTTTKPLQPRAALIGYGWKCHNDTRIKDDDRRHLEWCIKDLFHRGTLGHKGLCVVWHGEMDPVCERGPVKVAMRKLAISPPDMGGSLSPSCTLIAKTLQTIYNRCGLRGGSMGAMPWHLPGHTLDLVVSYGTEWPKNPNPIVDFHNGVVPNNGEIQGSTWAE
ncbi:hypothetical protein BT63DRAFT_437754 [Microthyrium microscopicum]|uniref:Ecp2 effector protein domain-containing protein n=1 Tax=Microthyrium microscopicum TaxID=703497 RepID=A0A6A6ULN3_9PEZI|nr:hypothetical protein BT63DRAFT_437754 [Microthyrium microscopicum]